MCVRLATVCLSLVVLAPPCFVTGIAAERPSDEWTLFNPTGRAYKSELLRPLLELPAEFTPGGYALLEDGREVPAQVEQIDGRPWLWVLTDVEPGQRKTYRVVSRKPAEAKSRVKLARDGASYVLENEHLAVRVPAAAEAGQAPPSPVEKLRLADGRWIGRGHWNLPYKLKSLKTTVVGEGPLFVKVALRYDFDGLAGLDGDEPAFSHVTITLAADRQHATIEEEHRTPRGSYWEFDVAAGWSPRKALTIPHFGGFTRPTLNDLEGKPWPFPPESLNVGQTRMGDVLLNLIPRWSQAYDDGWWFTANDGQQAAGATVVRAGRWLWPHENMVSIVVRPSADYAGLRCPTRHGRRQWLLVAGPAGAWPKKAECEDYVIRHSFESLDKLHHEYILDWPGLKPPEGQKVADDWAQPDGKFGRRTKAFFGWGPGAGHLTGPGKHPLATLAHAQLIFDPDTFGNYWIYFSPENPNFATHWWQQGFWDMAKLKDHPQFARLRPLAEQKMREDMYHSITLPGGAGQECPGYQAGPMNAWKRLSATCRDDLGFDLTQWPQYRAGGSFLLHLSQPFGDGSRRSHPAGDTHPPGPNVLEMARERGVDDDPAQFTTEELPGFGVVFRNHADTPRESYLAFKSGPNRGHFHGDQLAFHYCPYARPQVVDHHCSYNPRAGQEHMHNRVAFHTPELPYANMDGYERLIALQKSPVVDVAVGQVESERLRITEPFPPEKWDWKLPQQALDKPLVYRRTVVMVKGAQRDYFVFRDQYAGPDVSATYCLHVYGERIEQKGSTFEFEPVTLHVASPEKFETGRHDWEHKNGGLEKTVGLRLTTAGRGGEFVTVLVPRKVKLPAQLEVRLHKAVSRADDSTTDLIVALPLQGDKLAESPIAVRTPRYDLAANRGTAEKLDATASSASFALGVELGGDRTYKARKGTLAIELKRGGDGMVGTYRGQLGGEDVQGTASASVLHEGYPFAVQYADEPGPSVTPIPGGVRVGDDEIVFAGGIDQDAATTYVSVRRAGKPVLELTGKQIDLDRPQGDIGLFVPDAGYPFGPIPNWLIKQRTKRPDWYRQVWPPRG